MNNYEKIKKMTIDEMLNLILRPLCSTCAYIDECPMAESYDCAEGVKQWLESGEE